MLPTLQPGQFVFVSPLPYFFSDPKITDLVVLEKNGVLLVKRIYYKDRLHYVVHGDNDTESTDSRSFGPVTKKDILAKVIFIPH